MFDDDTRISRDNERFSQKREQVIETINRHILETSISHVLEGEIYAQTSLLNQLSATSLQILNNNPEYKGTTALESRELLEALQAGMAFACWTHDAENDAAAKDNIVHSLEYTEYHMRYARHADTDDSTLFARYESAMEQVDAVDAYQDAIEQERELIELCAHNFGARSENVRNAFKRGYGFIRRAVTLPYGHTPERSSYNLELLGITKQLQDLFLKYCKEDLVFETDNIVTFYTRRTEALKKFRNDPFVTGFFKEGQRFSLVGGICKIAGVGEPQSRISKYHSLDQGDGIVINGSFDRFTVGSSLNGEGAAIVRSQQHVNTDDIIEPMLTGIHMRLKNVTIHFGANEAGTESDDQPLSQIVTIPLNIENQQLLYRK